MKKIASRYLPDYESTLEVLQMTQEQLSDTSKEYSETDSFALQNRTIERIEALSAMREDSGRILSQVKQIESIRKNITDCTRKIYQKTKLDTAA
jgi:hypothetical protein